MVGAARFELATSCPPGKRANQAALRPDFPILNDKAQPGTISPRADVAQWIEHQSSELRVGGSNPFVRATARPT